MLWFKEKRIGRFWFYGGIVKGLAIGFSVDKWHITLDLGIFWCGVEW
jgi:hypothetical protein